MLNRAKHELKKIEKNLAARARSERVVLLGLSLVLMWGLGVLLFIEPARASMSAHAANRSAAQSRLLELNTSYQEMLAIREQDPNEISRARLDVLMREQQTLDEDIAGLAGDLISPGAMTELLISILEKQQGLNLLGFENMPAREIFLSEDAEESPVANTNSTGESGLTSVLYRHGLQIDFEGDYFSTLQYLRFLEGVSESFFWDSLYYSELEWPNARVRLEIHTLSTQEGFIGG